MGRQLLGCRWQTNKRCAHTNSRLLVCGKERGTQLLLLWVSNTSTFGNCETLIGKYNAVEARCKAVNDPQTGSLQKNNDQAGRFEKKGSTHSVKLHTHTA